MSLKIEPFYCDMHIHTYADANKRESVHYDVDALLARVRACARGSKAMISLTDHNVINTDAYKEASEKAGDDVALILGVELHVKANGPKPYHAHAYFNVEPNDDNIEALNEVLDDLYPDKLPSKDDDIPQLPAILNAFQKHEFLFLPHGGQAHGTFDRAVGADERFDDLMMRSIYYNTFDGFTARSCANVDNTVLYFQRIGIDEFTNLLTGSDNYDPTKYSEPKSSDADEFTPTWIVAEASFDGLRMALSEKSRLHYSSEPPESFSRPTPSIERIRLNKDNIDIDVDLTPGLNVIIGGSSTGKTLLLEAIARRTGILKPEERHSFYDKFGINDVELERNDQTDPYYINQSYISSVVGKSVDHDTIESIQILKDVFPQDQDASDVLDTNFEKVRSLVSSMFAASDAVHESEQMLRRLSAPNDLITIDSLDSNPIAIMQPSAQLKPQLLWKPAVENEARTALAGLEEMFEGNPLLPSIRNEVEALTKQIARGKEITVMERKVASALAVGAQEYSTAQGASKESDKKKRTSVQNLLSSIVKLRNGLRDFDDAKAELLKQEFEDMPKQVDLAGHHLGVVYSFKMSAQFLLDDINMLLNVDHKFGSIDEVTAETLADSLAGADRRRNITTMSAYGNAVSANLEKRKKRTFSIKTKAGLNWNDLSEGRKTAVLLDLILAFDGNFAPLIIDQPEDNLAADYINTGLANAIKESKATRQTIVVTHNATIPMLADAQTVVLCQSEGDKLVIRSAPLEGTLGGKRVLDWIVEITDGGEPSVQKRFRKYNFRRFGGR